MSADPERVPLVDVGARVDAVVAELVAAGYAREGDDDGDGRLDVRRGDGRL